MTAAPIVLGPNVVRRAYRGGEGIAQLRGLAAEEVLGPEDWVGSTTHVWERPDLGVTTLPDGAPLAEAVAADPGWWLGPGRGETGVLLKLLDAGERLMVHAHPDRAFAGRHLGLDHGKTEAWIVAGARGPRPRVWLGFSEEMPRARLDRLVEDQDVASMLGALNEVPVSEGDVLFIPAGLPHAIGDDLLIVELQEPSDLSAWIEWPDRRVRAVTDGDMGLGVDVALDAVDRSAWPADRLATLRRREHGLLPAAASAFFQARALTPGEVLESAFSLLVVTAGEGSLETGAGSLPLRRGSTVLVPFAAGPARVEGSVRGYRALGPAC